jgi:hypothetical protein
LAARRTEILQSIARQLGLDAPDANMKQTFDRFAAGYRVLQALSIVSEPRHFSLWRKEELRARIDQGEQIPSFAKDSDGEIIYTLGIDFAINEGDAAEASLAAVRRQIADLVWPINIGAGATGDPDAQIDAGIAWVRDSAAQLANVSSAEMQRSAVMLVLHETVETTLVSHYIRSADRRWFCEGVANFVALNVLRELIGDAGATNYYDVAQELAKYSSLQTRIDLLRWPVAEAAAATQLPPDLNAASYAFATASIASAFTDLPRDALAKTLQQAARDSDAMNMDTVEQAYRQVALRSLRAFAATNTHR